jgi:LDH2 family malate/lactate/ureidoglycolate dehydrogenase
VRRRTGTAKGLGLCFVVLLLAAALAGGGCAGSGSQPQAREPAGEKVLDRPLVYAVMDE